MELENRLYHKYANLFELNITNGKLYEVSKPLTKEQEKCTVFFIRSLLYLSKSGKFMGTNSKSATPKKYAYKTTFP